MAYELVRRHAGRMNHHRTAPGPKTPVAQTGSAQALLPSTHSTRSLSPGRTSFGMKSALVGTRVNSRLLMLPGMPGRHSSGRAKANTSPDERRRRAMRGVLPPSASGLLAAWVSIMLGLGTVITVPRLRVNSGLFSVGNMACLLVECRSASRAHRGY